MNRRAVLGASVAAFAGLAGCSGSNEGVENTEDGDQVDTTTENGNHDSGTVTENSGSNNSNNESDPSFAWEGDLEELIVGSQYPDDFPDHPAGVESEYIQIDSTSEQISYPVETGGVLESNSLSLDQETVAFVEADQQVGYDSAYLIAKGDDLQAGGDTTLFAWFPVSDRWDNNVTALENLPGAVQRIDGEYSQEELVSVFEDDIAGYDDASADFPQEYLDMIEG